MCRCTHEERNEEAQLYAGGTHTCWCHPHRFVPDAVPNPDAHSRPSSAGSSANEHSSPKVNVGKAGLGNVARTTQRNEQGVVQGVAGDFDPRLHTLVHGVPVLRSGLVLRHQPASTSDAVAALARLSLAGVHLGNKTRATQLIVARA